MTTPETSCSLLERARDPADALTWRRLHQIYAPLLRRWVSSYVARPDEVDDLVQDVFAVLARELPHFERAGHIGSFRGWLRSITVNRVRAYWHARAHRPVAIGGEDFWGKLEQLEAPDSTLARSWDEEHDRHVLATLMDTVRMEFHSSTWWAFEGTVVQGRPNAEVAAELGLSLNAVLVAKSRVLKRLRQKAEGLVD